MAIEKISENKRKQIINKSVNPLPNNPSKAGYKADEIKKAMFNFVTDEKDSVIDEINRVVDETNASFDDIDNTNQKTSKTIESINNNIKQLNDTVSDKVDKEEGKQLSSNDFSSEEKEKLAKLTNYDDSEVRAGIREIKSKIPAQASKDNKLADKDFVNSSIETATATFRGTFISLNDLLDTVADKNDYAFYNHVSNNNRQFMKYKWDGKTWKYEYTLNNSSFTDAQWKAINSGATAELINKILTNADNINTILNTLNNIDTRLNNAVDKSSPQDISGLKNFTERPTVNNTEVALKTDIAEGSGTTVTVNGDPVTEFNADDKLDKTGGSISGALEFTGTFPQIKTNQADLVVQTKGGQQYDFTNTEFRPTANYVNTLNIGKSDRKFKDGYFSGNVDAGSLSVASTYPQIKGAGTNVCISTNGAWDGTGGEFVFEAGGLRPSGNRANKQSLTGWQNGTFGGTVKATTFDGNATSATKATQDSDGKQINTTYVKVVSGKGLSSNDFTDALLTKLNGIADGATKITTTRNLTLNGGTALPVYATGVTNASWYAPTTVGSANQVLKSNGSGAPTWINQSAITAGNASKVANALTFQNSASATDTFNGSGAKTLVGKVVDMFTAQTIAGVKTFSSAPKTSATVPNTQSDGTLAPTSWVKGLNILGMPSTNTLNVSATLNGTTIWQNTTGSNGYLNVSCTSTSSTSDARIILCVADTSEKASSTETAVLSFTAPSNKSNRTYAGYIPVPKNWYVRILSTGMSGFEQCKFVYAGV